MKENGGNLFETDEAKENKLCYFTLNTHIYDIDLPTKIKEKLQGLNLSVNPDKVYTVEVTFDMKAYTYPEFYGFPVERRQWEIEKLKTLDDIEKKKTIICDVLSAQLNNICKIIDDLHIRYKTANIVGDNFDNVNHVEFKIDKGVNSPLTETQTDKSKKKDRYEDFKTIGIIPDRPYTLKKAAEIFADMFLRKIKEDNIKNIEKSKHTPNMVKAKDIFSALAKALVDEFPESFHSAESLTDELLKQAFLKNDWPLEICYDGGVTDRNELIDADGEIDCPEYLIFIKKKYSWVLKKEIDLTAAKHTVLYNGYNKKAVEQIIILHNLKPLRFNLYILDNEEIKPVSKAEAHTAKKLYLSWCEQ